MNPSDRAQVLAQVLVHSQELEALAQAERWGEALAVHEKRQVAIGGLLSAQLSTEQQRELSQLIHRVLESDHNLLQRLEAVRDRMAKELSQLQHGQSAIKAYRDGE